MSYTKLKFPGKGLGLGLVTSASRVPMHASLQIPLCIIIGVTIGFEQTGIQVAENAGNVPVCVRILQPAAADARLGSDSFRVGMRTQQTADGNKLFCLFVISSVVVTFSGARASEDFFHRSQIVTLSSAVRHQCLIIPIVHDTLFERTEAFNVSLFRSPSLPSYVTLAPNMAVVRITHVHGETSNNQHLG